MRIGSWTATAALAAVLAAAGCDDLPTGDRPADGPAPPRDLQAFYYDRAVHLSWELDPRWRDEPFRVYGKRTTDADFFFVAEVTSCRESRCAYADRNVSPNRRYEYFVTAVSPRTGIETATASSVLVDVPDPVPPPVPGSLRAVALDGAVYLHWDRRARDAGDFAFYRVYLDAGDGSTVFLGETDSEGFLDLLVENGNTYGYFVSSVDDQGHESQGTATAFATPRPDFHGEILYAFEDRPALSGFRFQETEAADPVMPGDHPDRDFRIEIDAEGWWLVPAPGVEVHRNPIPTTALKCGPAADAGCTDVSVAPAGNYSGADIGLGPLHSFVIRVPASGGQWHYGVVRVTHVGFAQDGAIVIFDWAFQLQPGNRSLSPPAVAP